MGFFTSLPTNVTASKPVHAQRVHRSMLYVASQNGAALRGSTFVPAYSPPLKAVSIIA
ncbi:MAG: hypothetical protein LM564_02265 [Desulfurococcaceae archaeon]|nr:hypothetical protein [Desulfurococcaceae archaeon]